MAQTGGLGKNTDAHTNLPSREILPSNCKMRLGYLFIFFQSIPSLICWLFPMKTFPEGSWCKAGENLVLASELFDILCSQAGQILTGRCRR